MAATSSPTEASPASPMKLGIRVAQSEPCHDSGAQTAMIVATTARTMPKMPNALPRFDVSNRDSPANAKMNSRPATM